MRTRGGNKKSNGAIAKRRLEVAKRLPQGEQVGALAKELGVSRVTLWRDIKKLTLQFSDASREAFQQYKQAHLNVLQKMAHAVLEEKVSPDVAGEFRKYQQDIAKLLGLNAESRSVVAHVTAEIDPAKLKGYRRFVYETRFLPESKLPQVWAFIRTIEEIPTAESTLALMPADEEGL
jgi:DNA-binding Lrp family transcriptional regulator